MPSLFRCRITYPLSPPSLKSSLTVRRLPDLILPYPYTYPRSVPSSTSVMIASQLGRAARATTQPTVCTASRTATCPRTAIPPAFCYSQRLQQRRPSSSKASCPPDDGSEGPRAATSTQKTSNSARSHAVRGSAARSARGRKAREAEAWKENEKGAVFSNLPRVPSTNDMRMQHSGTCHQRALSLDLNVVGSEAWASRQ